MCCKTLKQRDKSTKNNPFKLLHLEKAHTYKLMPVSASSKYGVSLFQFWWKPLPFPFAECRKLHFYKPLKTSFKKSALPHSEIHEKSFAGARLGLYMSLLLLNVRPKRGPVCCSCSCWVLGQAAGGSGTLSSHFGPWMFFLHLWKLAVGTQIVNLLLFEV